MKSTGIVRKVDELGRVVIPVEMSRTLGIDIKDSVEFFVDDETIVLKKYHHQSSCLVTGKISEDNLSLADGKIVLSPEVAEALIKEIHTTIKKEQGL